VFFDSQAKVVLERLAKVQGNPFQPSVEVPKNLGDLVESQAKEEYPRWRGSRLRIDLKTQAFHELLERHPTLFLYLPKEAFSLLRRRQFRENLFSLIGRETILFQVSLELCYELLVVKVPLIGRRQLRPQFGRGVSVGTARTQGRCRGGSL